MLQGSELIESLIGIFNSDKLLTLVMATISHVVRRNKHRPRGKKKHYQSEALQTCPPPRCSPRWWPSSSPIAELDDGGWERCSSKFGT